MVEIEAAVLVFKFPSFLEVVKSEFSKPTLELVVGSTSFADLDSNGFGCSSETSSLPELAFSSDKE